MTGKQFIDDREVAAISGFKVQTLRNWRHRGVGPPYSKIGRAVRYDRAELISFIEARKVTPDNFKSEKT
jgi:predicted DNA-binding transcriptional regulator AlpA